MPPQEPSASWRWTIQRSARCRARPSQRPRRAGARRRGAGGRAARTAPPMRLSRRAAVGPGAASAARRWSTGTAATGRWAPTTVRATTVWRAQQREVVDVERVPTAGAASARAASPAAPSHGHRPKRASQIRVKTRVASMPAGLPDEVERPGACAARRPRRRPGAAPRTPRWWSRDRAARRRSWPRCRRRAGATGSTWRRPLGLRLGADARGTGAAEGPRRPW